MRVDLRDVFVFADMAVNFAKMEVMRGGESISLTTQEFKTLKFMIQNPERVISREELLNQVWGYQNYPLLGPWKPYPEATAKAGGRPIESGAFSNLPPCRLQVCTVVLPSEGGRADKLETPKFHHQCLRRTL